MTSGRSSLATDTEGSRTRGLYENQPSARQFFLHLEEQMARDVMGRPPKYNWLLVMIFRCSDLSGAAQWGHEELMPWVSRRVDPGRQP